MTEEKNRNRALADRAVEMAGLKKGSRILDIGCGEGDTVAYLRDELGMDAEGIDTNLAKISAGKEKYPGIPIRYGDGEFLDEYMSFTFDGILIEGALSRTNMPDEALHEAWCVMKKGGRIMIADVYEKDPDPKQMRAVEIEADRLSRIQRKEGDCEDRGMKFVAFRHEDAFYKDPLIREMESIGFEILGFEDRTKEAKGLWTEEETKTGRGKKKLGYFLLAAAKPL